MVSYQVRYYSRRDRPNRPVHRGGGVRVRAFTDRASAEAFAAEHQVYGKPCVVEEVRK